MSSLFSAQDRDATLRALTQFAGTAADILGVLLVGSGATEFPDAYADLDIVYVAASDAFPEVLGAVQRFVTVELQPVFQTTYQHRDDVVVLCLLLDSNLAVDIGVWAEASLFASSPRWRVVWHRD